MGTFYLIHIVHKATFRFHLSLIVFSYKDILGGISQPNFECSFAFKKTCNSPSFFCHLQEELLLFSDILFFLYRYSTFACSLQKGEKEIYSPVIIPIFFF